ncbi:MAG: glycosyltransferase family 2 protein, partial [Candidatus Eremiobacteraeota bacterium]|nr:glycosyltransferase family 2 protein [Candidatus Eremiobacteraeota bacterium]
MDYSIIIPVFNKAGLTRNCLETLRPTLEGAGQGEVIVVDNASTDETPEMLAEFPWAHVVRNERNLGFAGANNQAAALARGRILVLLNNDTQGHAGWLSAMMAALEDPGVGIVGARLLYPGNTIQHAGVIVGSVLFGRAGLSPYHYAWQNPATDPDVNSRREYQVVTGACMATPRELYARLGGLDEVYWNGYEDVDYCLKVREQGLKVVYEPKATLFHFESQSGVQRFRKVFWNVRTLAERWSDRVHFDAVERNVEVGKIQILLRDPEQPMSFQLFPTPASTVLVHGNMPEDRRPEFETVLRSSRSPVAQIVRCDEGEALAAARDAMQVRGDRYLVFVDARAKLEEKWLDALVAQSTFPPNVAAVTYAPELPAGENVVTLASDARCTLLSLKQFPQHLELGAFDTLDGAVADLLMKIVECGRGTRGVARPLGTLPPVAQDASFERARARTLASVFDPEPAAVEAVLRARPQPERGLVSIVTLSWNAPSFTVKALESIRNHTS